MTSGDASKPGGPCWDDLMLVRAFDEVVQTFQEMHGLAVAPLSEEVSRTGDAEASLDHLKDLNLQEVGEKEALPHEEATEAPELDVDESELEQLILAAHADDGSNEEQGAIGQPETTAGKPLEARIGNSLREAGPQELEESGLDVDQTDEAAEMFERGAQSAEQEQTSAPESGEEYTVEQYYEWLQWRASQQGAAPADETTPPATTVIHHHHYYYSADGSNAACWQPGPAPSGDAVGASDTAPGTEALSHSRTPKASSKPPTAWTESLPLHLPPPSHSYLPPVPANDNLPACSNPNNAGAPVRMQRARFELTHECPGSDECYMTVTAMPKYQSTSVEELRRDDYACGTRFVRFDPPNVGAGGFHGDEYSQCLTAMTAYRNKSQEELRWEDYSLGEVPAGSTLGGVPREDALCVGTGPSAGPGQGEGLTEGRQHVFTGAASTREEAGSPSRDVQGFVFPSAGEGAPAEYEGADGRRRQGDGADSRVRSEGQHEATGGGRSEALSNTMIQQGFDPWGSQQQAEVPAQRGLFGQPVASENQGPHFEGDLPRPSSILAGAASGTQDGGALPEIDPVLQDLLSAYYWMGYQTARYLQSRRT